MYGSRPTYSSPYAPALLLAATLLLVLSYGREANARQQGDFEGYECPESCLPPECFCPSASPPGGLPPAEVPQFVLLTYDDAVQPEGFALAASTLEGLNPNECPRAATFFVNTNYTDYWLTQQLYAAGHEIANHTMTHSTGIDTSSEDWLAEIKGARTVLSVLGGVPEGQMSGFRAPFLVSSDESFSAIHAEGFLYDSSIPEGVAGLSLSPEAKIWPYTLDNGAIQACWAGACTDASWPGLFEVPLWTLDAADGTGVAAVAAMDPDATGSALESLLRENFIAHYDGNRAPFGVFIHPSWLLDDPSRISILESFFDWAATHENVWFVTTSAVIEWMKDPIPAADFNPACRPRTPEGAERCDGADNDGDGTIDEGLVNTCAYPEGNFRTCSPCPAAWPTPALPLSIEVPIEGGSVASVVTEDWGGGFCAELQVQNDSGERVLDWRLDFDLLGAELTSGWLGTFSSEGERVTVQPLEWDATLEPGRTVTTNMCAERIGALAFAEIELQFFGIGAGIPSNDDVTRSPPAKAVPTASWPAGGVLVALLIHLGRLYARAPGRRA